MSEKNQRKSNGRGGKRANAGRKAGAATKKTRDIADKAAAEGLTPLEVMLRAMRRLVEKSEALDRGEREEGEKVTSLEVLITAAEVAKDAAPYMHPRLASIEHSGPEGGPIATTSDDARAQRLAALLARAAARRK